MRRLQIQGLSWSLDADFHERRFRLTGGTREDAYAPVESRLDDIGELIEALERVRADWMELQSRAAALGAKP